VSPCFDPPGALLSLARLSGTGGGGGHGGLEDGIPFLLGYPRLQRNAGKCLTADTTPAQKRTRPALQCFAFLWDGSPPVWV
jgi:hypothetical protein